MSQQNDTLSALISARETYLDGLPEKYRTPLRALDAAIVAFREISNDDVILFQERPKEFSRYDAPATASDYSIKMKLRDKFLYFLNKEGRFLHLREVADLIRRAEGLSEESTHVLPEKISHRIAPLKKGAIKKIQIGNQNRNTYWGKKEWLDENGNARHGREHNPAYLTNPDAPDLVSVEEELDDI